MSKRPLSIRERQDRRDFDAILSLRRELLWEVPITSAQITLCDYYLAKHPRTDIRDLIDIVYRNMFVQSIMFDYIKDEPVARVGMLCAVHRQLEEWMALPERIRKCLGNPFLPWEELLAKEEEEEKERANG
jgi:hypothetical protein